MHQQNLKQKYNSFKLKILENKLLALIIGILFISFSLIAYSIPWNTQTNTTAITPETIKHIATAEGQLQLITEPDQGMTPVYTLIKNATKSIDLVMYEFKDKAIGDALIAAAKRGVAVRVLVNGGYYAKQEPMNDPAFAYLQAGGVSVERTPQAFALTHQKTMVVDNDKAFIMTFNFVPTYYNTGRDFGIIDTNPIDVKAIEDTFNADWQNKKITPSNGDDLVWSPNSEDDMIMIIKSATKTLDIYNEEMADQRITTTLENSAKSGVSVNVIMTYSTANKPVFTELKNAGVNIHTYKNSKKNLYIHAKMILADNSSAFLGSENFSVNSLLKNRELGIFITDPTILYPLSKTFNSDWQGGTVF